MVELQPSKLVTGVRFPSPALSIRRRMTWSKAGFVRVDLLVGASMRMHAGQVPAHHPSGAADRVGALRFHHVLLVLLALGLTVVVGPGRRWGNEAGVRQ